MKSRNGSAKSLLVVVLMASVMLNVSFVAGCKWLEDLGLYSEKSAESENPTPSVSFKNEEELKRVLKPSAESLGMQVSSNKTVMDIATDIQVRIDASKQKMPELLSDETIAKLKKLLKPEERDILDAYQKAIRDAQGKEVLYLPVDGE